MERSASARVGARRSRTGAVVLLPVRRRMRSATAAGRDAERLQARDVGDDRLPEHLKPCRQVTEPPHLLAAVARARRHVAEARSLRSPRGVRLRARNGGAAPMWAVTRMRAPPARRLPAQSA